MSCQVFVNEKHFDIWELGILKRALLTSFYASTLLLILSKRNNGRVSFFFSLRFSVYDLSVDTIVSRE